VLLRNAELNGRFPSDLRVSGGTVTEVAPGLPRRGGEPVYDCQGGSAPAYRSGSSTAAAPCGCSTPPPWPRSGWYPAPVPAGPGRPAPAILVSSGVLPPRVCLLGVPLGRTLPGDRVQPGDEGRRGPSSGHYKIVLADSGLLTCDELTERIRAAHAAGHAALVPPELIPELARLGVRVVTQPGFLADRGDDFLRDAPPPTVPTCTAARPCCEAASRSRCPATPRSARSTRGP
jgi:hypothetical protein